MAVAARAPQSSTPSGAIQIREELFSAPMELTLGVRRYISMDDSIEIEGEASVGTSAYIEVSDEVGVEDKLFHFYLNSIGFQDTIDIEVSQNFVEQLLSVDPDDIIGSLYIQDKPPTVVHPSIWFETEDGSVKSIWLVTE